MSEGTVGLHGALPASVRLGRWLIVLVCYLDDSGKDQQSDVTTLAGFAARDEDWKAFETAVEPIFQKHNVPILHAMDLEKTEGHFKGWRVLKKQAFVAQICSVMSEHSMLGISMSCLKSTYDMRAKERKTKRNPNRPYTFCFNAILDWLLKDYRTGKAAWNEGVSFIIEAGHENNPEAELAFYAIRKKFGLEKVLKSICFVPKDHSRAIQMADLFAYYSRRDSGRFLKAQNERREHAQEQMLKIITEKGPFRGFVATDFNRPSYMLDE
jgi:hypothetical protein